MLDQPAAGWVLEQVAGEEASAPAHQPAEVLSALSRLVRAGEIEPATARDALDEATALPQRPVLPAAAHLRRAYALLERIRVLDGLYVALADELGCTLVTTDRREHTLAGTRGSQRDHIHPHLDVGSQGGDVRNIRGQHLNDGTGDISGYALRGHRNRGADHRRCRYQTSQLDSSIRVGPVQRHVVADQPVRIRRTMITAPPTSLHSNRSRDGHPPVSSHDGLHDRAAPPVAGPDGPTRVHLPGPPDHVDRHPRPAGKSTSTCCPTVHPHCQPAGDQPARLPRRAGGRGHRCGTGWRCPPRAVVRAEIGGAKK